MSTQITLPPAGSHTGPSPSTAAASTTSSTSRAAMASHLHGTEGAHQALLFVLRDVVPASIPVEGVGRGDSPEFSGQEVVADEEGIDPRRLAADERVPPAVAGLGQGGEGRAVVEPALVRRPPLEPGVAGDGEGWTRPER